MFHVRCLQPGGLTFALVIQALRLQGYTAVTVQAGRGATRLGQGKRTVAGLEYDVYDYKPSLQADMLAADLVISHAGAR